MLPHFARSTASQAAILALLTLLAPVAAASPAAASDGRAAPDRAAADDDASLAAARDRSARLQISVEGLKRAMSPGHLTEPMPDIDRSSGLDALRGDYADVQRKAAGYRATLGDRHPTLVAAEQVLADLRTQLLDGTRKALAGAEREAAEARGAVGVLERRLAARAAAAPAQFDRSDVTGGIEAPPPPRIPAASPEATAAEPSDAPAPERRTPAPSHALAGALLGLAAGLLASLAIAWVALQRLAARRRVRRPEPRRVEPALSGSAPSAMTPPAADEVAPADRPSGLPSSDDTVPVLATLPASADADADLAAASGLHAMLRAAFAAGPAARMIVLVAPTGGLSAAEADGAALALAFAAAAAGRRPLVMEARAMGRLRRERVASGAAPLLIEAGGTLRTLYRLDACGFTVEVLPSDPGEAEAATDAARCADTARLHGLSAFDTVILLGDDPEALARSADVVLLAAPAGTTSEDLVSVARSLREGGRFCGALLVARAAVAVVPPVRPAFRRRIVADAGQTAAARLGLRGTLDPGRRRIGG